LLHDFTQDKFDIIIQAGQSNADGWGFGPVDTPFTPDDRVWYMNANGTIYLATERVLMNCIQSDFSLSFARRYIGEGFLAEGRKLLILRTAVGGTGFLDNHWNLTGDLYLRMMEMIRTALSINPENRLVAFLWHQGELDVGYGATYEQHYNHLKDLIDSVRNTFDARDLPFLAGDFVPHWRDMNIANCTSVLNAIRAVCRDCSHSAFVETDGLTSNVEERIEHPLDWEDDYVHFSRNALYQLGNRYYEKFREIVG